MTKNAYQKAGVDTHLGQAFTSLIKKLQKKESEKRKRSPFAQKIYPYSSPMDFASLMDVSFLKKYKRPLLVTAVDGVGTKVHLAQLFDYHETVGIDLTAMCVNDILCSGAKSMQFLDYIACGQLVPAKMAKIIESILRACTQADCVLVGGETAEHPASMPPEQYDLAGFALGVVECEHLIDGQGLEPGDAVIGLPSSGVHSNGLSLIRELYLKEKLYLPEQKSDCDFLFEEILKKPTLIYEPVLRPLLAKEDKSLRALVHITGGGFFENIPRVLKEGLGVTVQSSSWEIPSLFLSIAERGSLSTQEMLHIFNMGIGMAAFVRKETLTSSLALLRDSFETHYPEIKALPVQIGEVISRTKKQPVIQFD